MEREIDTSEMNVAIEKAAKEFKQKPNDAAAKTALAEAYFVRATALTEAAQYRSALGDYRRGLKLDPTNTEAKEMQDQIINIFQSLNREPPKEGTEPTPLPFKKA
jgi:tetratricopeptide (TPR) repeat protein